MDYLSVINRPIEKELEQFNSLFDVSLSCDTGILDDVLQHIRRRMGKRMRPILVFLVAKAFGEVSMVTQNTSIGLELLHTASLVHDDVVDEAGLRRGQPSVNAVYDNKVSVLVGDFILAMALLKIFQTRNYKIIENLSMLGGMLVKGELLQLDAVKNDQISEEAYFEVVKHKTASMFEMCAGMGAMSVGMRDEIVEKAKVFGMNLGIAFQIRDDIFDYYEDLDVGKPTGSDMMEGELTLPVIYALNSSKNPYYFQLAMKVKKGEATKEDVEGLISFAKSNGGIEYAEKCKKKYHSYAMEFIDTCIEKTDIRKSLAAYVDYVVGRKW